MKSDLDLLERFRHENSQEAFGEIVRRHLNLVYSAALRQVRSPQLAEEIAQSVFTDLARQAGKLKADTILTSWLYAVTCRTAVDAIRRESRRQLREQIAVEMNCINSTANDLSRQSGAEAEWKQIEPLLDAAMGALDEADRSAVLLRYFENRSLREVGAALGASEDAAQKRVSRAVERLREFFSKQNVTIGASGLAVLLSANAVQAAPVALAAAVSASAFLAGTAVSTSTVIAATTKTLAMTALQKSIIGTTLVGAIGTGFFAVHHAALLKEQNQTLQQRQALLAGQIRQLQQERDDATNQLAGLLAENELLKSNSNENELLKLRAKVTQLEGAAAQSENDPTEFAAKSLVIKVNQLKQWLEQHPDEKIPELQFVTYRDWFNAALSSAQLNSDDDYRWELHNLFAAAEDQFGEMAYNALRKYVEANKGQFPADLSQLQPYFESPVDEAILQRYAIVPANRIPKSKEMSDTWLIAQNARAFENYKNEGREVIGPKGYGNSWTFW